MCFDNHWLKNCLVHKNTAYTWLKTAQAVRERKQKRTVSMFLKMWSEMHAIQVDVATDCVGCSCFSTSPTLSRPFTRWVIAWWWATSRTAFTLCATAARRTSWLCLRTTPTPGGSPAPPCWTTTPWPVLTSSATSLWYVHSRHPDMTSAVDWALKANYLSIYVHLLALSLSLCLFPCLCLSLSCKNHANPTLYKNCAPVILVMSVDLVPVRLFNCTSYRSVFLCVCICLLFREIL